MSKARTAPDGRERKPFEIFRGADARDYAEGVMSMDDATPVITEGLSQFSAAGDAGQSVKLVYSTPGLSLTHVWFKSGYPLPLHSHTADCVYYIVAGSVRIGDEVLGPGDGFFVGADVPYTYEPGPEGVEVLEFRNTDKLNIRFMAKTKSAWDRMIAVSQARQADWAHEGPPTHATAVEQMTEPSTLSTGTCGRPG